jgi:hypothetical protein
MGMEINEKKTGGDIFKTGGGIVLTDRQTPAANSYDRENALKNSQ